MSADFAKSFLALILDDSPSAAYLEVARRGVDGGMREAEVEQSFADAAYAAFPEPRIAERLCQIFAAEASTG